MYNSARYSAITPSFDLSKLEEDDRKIISYLQEHEKATAKELESFLKKSRSTLRRKLKNLIAEEYIVWREKALRILSAIINLRARHDSTFTFEQAIRSLNIV